MIGVEIRRLQGCLGQTRVMIASGIVSSLMTSHVGCQVWPSIIGTYDRAVKARVEENQGVLGMTLSHLVVCSSSVVFGSQPEEQFAQAFAHGKLALLSGAGEDEQQQGEHEMRGARVRSLGSSEADGALLRLVGFPAIAYLSLLRLSMWRDRDYLGESSPR